MQFHIGTDHDNQETTAGEVCITPPGESEQCFPFTTGYEVYTHSEDHETDCIVGEIKAEFPLVTAETVVTCYEGSDFVEVDDAPNSNPVQSTAVPLNACDAMYAGRGSVYYMFTAEVTGAESGTYYIRTQNTNDVMNPCYDTSNSEADDYTCQPGMVTYLINMAVAEQGNDCESEPPVASGTIAESYGSCAPPAFNGFVCPVLCAGEDSTQTGILTCNDGTWEDSIVCIGAETAVPTPLPTADPTAVPTPLPTFDPTASPTAEPTATPTTLMPTQAPIPCASSQENDIIFLMDASGSVTHTEWTQLVEFVEEVVLEYVPDNSRVAVAGYSTDGYVHFDLETYGTTTTDRAAIALDVANTPKISGSTYTLTGLQFVMDNLVVPQSQDGRVTKLFLLTDGTSGQDTCSITKALKDANVHVTLVTIGDDWELETHYNCLLNSPEDHVILGAGFEAMESISSFMETSLCAEVTDFPTMSPTPTPTTGIPTVAPTTVEPTALPTPKPTAVPTRHPTDVPTGHPTAAPSRHPTEVPTGTPVVAPTNPPTDERTPMPTLAPTDERTKMPTLAPTDERTPMPTLAPTDERTPMPTLAPTDERTPQPTMAPTDERTPQPTMAPTMPVPSPVPSPTASPVAVSCSNNNWSQCGGVNWSGETCCPEGTQCYVRNAWYSQCRTECPAGWQCNGRRRRSSKASGLSM